MVAADSARRGVGFCRFHDRLVVCCQAVVNLAVEKHVAQLEKVCVHVRLARISDIGRLFVRAFAKPYADAIGEQLLHVGLGTVKVGLNYDADSAAHSRACMDAAHDVERDLRQARVLHVDADEVFRSAGVYDEVSGDGLGQIRRLLKTHLRKLDTDIGFDASGGDGIEQFVIDIGSQMRLAL